MSSVAANRKGSIHSSGSTASAASNNSNWWRRQNSGAAASVSHLPHPHPIASHKAPTAEEVHAAFVADCLLNPNPGLKEKMRRKVVGPWLEMNATRAAERKRNRNEMASLHGAGPNATSADAAASHSHRLSMDARPDMRRLGEPSWAASSPNLH